MNTRIWKPVIHGSTAKRAIAMALEVAQRCCSPQRIEKASHQLNPDGTPSIRWDLASVAGGDAGLALMCTYLHACFPLSGWDKHTHNFLSSAVDAYDFKKKHMGLFTGTTGLGLVALLASENERHYKTLRDALDTYLSVQLKAFLSQVNHGHLRVEDYDLILGGVGFVTYLISRNQLSTNIALNTQTEALLAYLVTLTKPNSDTGDYCLILPENMPVPERRKIYPNGYSDCGLAHGIPGIIGALALAKKTGWDTQGIRESLRSLTAWFVDIRIENAVDTNWPVMLPSHITQTSALTGSRAAWCYGVPGIVRALYLAGEALEDDNLRNLAINGLISLNNRPREQWGISSPIFCHGLSGVLQVSLRMYHDTNEARLLPLIHRIIDELMSLYNTDLLFGFQDKNRFGIWYDSPRLLEGAPGAALALLAATQYAPPSWDRLFLLS